MRPGRFLAFFGGLALVGLLTACGTSHDVTVPTTSAASATASTGGPSALASNVAPTAPPLPVPSGAELAAALLTPADLRGYALQSSGSGDSSFSGCQVLVNNPAGAIADPSVTLMDEGTGTTVSEMLLQMTPGDVPHAMNEYAAMPGSCHSFTGTVDGFTLSFSTAPLQVRALGDQTVAARITGEITGTNEHVYTDVVVVRHYSTLIVTSIAIVGQLPGTTLTETVAAKAYAKVAARW